MPIPYEPAGYLVLPAVLFYFAVVSTAGWFLCYTIARVMPSVDIVIDQFIALFATVRALAYFRASEQIDEVGALSFAFLCVPVSCIPHSSAFAQDAWARQMLRSIECFTARAAATWVAARCDGWAQGVHLMGLYLGLLLLPGLMDLTPKLANCRSVIALLCAQRAVVLLPYAAPFVGALAVPFVQATRLRDVAVYGSSLLLTKSLDDWISDCGRAEGACAYLCVFILLQMLSTAFIGSKDNNSAHALIIFAHDSADETGLPYLDGEH